MREQEELDRIEKLCTNKQSVSAVYAVESERSPGVIADSLYKSHLLTASTRTPRNEFTPVTKLELDFARRCGRFEGTEPSDLFLSAYYRSLLPIEGDALANCCSPSLSGSTGIVPMAVIGSIHDQLRHVSNLIVRAQHEVLLATNFWKASKSSTYISDALRELSKRSQQRGVKVIVRIMYDRGAAAQVFNNHQDVGPQGWTNVNVGLPNPQDIPGIDLKVVNFHRPPLGTFHCKFMVVDRRIATVSSNNVQDNDNLEMTTHLEGPIVDSIWDTFLVSWHNSLESPLPTRETDARSQPLPSSADHTFAAIKLDEAGHIQSQRETLPDDLPEHLAGGAQYDPSVGEEMVRMQATLRGKDGTSAAETVAQHLSSTTQSNFSSGLEPDARVKFLPFIAMHSPKLVPMAMVSRKPYANLNNESIHVPQNEAFLALIEHAKHSIFIQTPNLNAKDLLPALTAAVERGVQVTYYVCLGYNDAGEMLPGQGGTNEQAAKKLYQSLTSDEARSRLGVFFYVAADQQIPRHNSFKQRSCHIKLLIADEQVAIQGSGNQDTQTWYHSQEVNVMIDSAEVCAVWRAGIERNQNTARYGRATQDGFWRDEDGNVPPGTTRTGGGLSGVMHGALGMLRKAQGK